MYISSVASGSQTATLNTEHTLNSPAVAGRFKAIIDTVNMTSTDVLELRAKQISASAGTLRDVYPISPLTLYGVQSSPIITLGIIDNSWVEAGAVSFTLKQTYGTGRSYAWNIVNDVTAPPNISTLAIDSSGRLILQPTQTGVTIPTVTNLTNAVSTTYQIKKNTALANFEFPMFSSTTHNPVTGLTVTGEVSKDGVAFAALTNSASEVASGIYKVSLAAGDLNANVLTLKFTATGADTQFITIVTQV